MKEFVFNKNNYKDYESLYFDICKCIGNEDNIPIYPKDTFSISRLLFKKQNQKIKFIFKNFDVYYNRHHWNKDNYRYLDLIGFFEHYSKNSTSFLIEIQEDNPTAIEEKECTRKIIFNRKDYMSYKDFYAQIYDDLNGKHTIDWEECENLHYFADHLNEFLWYKSEENIKYVFLNFDQEKIKLHKNYDNYEYNIIIEIFERFVREYPNNKLEFRMEE